MILQSNESICMENIEVSNDVSADIKNMEVSLQDRIIEQIAASTAVVKSQQRHEPDLTFDERKSIVSELLLKSPSQFLYRFGQHLKMEHLQYFNEFADDPDVYFYIKETQKLLNETTSRIKLKNRRYGAMKKMQTTSSYFSPDEMKKRNPLLYEMLVNKNMTEDERFKRDMSSTSNIQARESFSGLLLEQIERSDRLRMCKRQEELENDTIEEYDDDELEDEEDEMEADDVTDPKEKEILKMEFDSSLYCQFLSGKDKDIDYKAIDESDEFDLLEHEIQDDEEKYFDEEEESAMTDDVTEFEKLQISSS